MHKTLFVGKEWLNPESSASTGSIAGYWGESPFETTSENPYVFLEIADCHGKVRLHMSDVDTKEDFIEKLTKLRDFVDSFITAIGDRHE